MHDVSNRSTASLWFHNFHLFSFETFFGGFTGMFWIIVMLHSPICFNFNFLADCIASSSSTLWYKKKFEMDSVRVRWSVPAAIEQLQGITFLASCSTAGMWFLCPNTVFWLHRTCFMFLWPNKPNLNSQCVLWQIVFCHDVFILRSWYPNPVFLNLFKQQCT